MNSVRPSCATSRRARSPRRSWNPNGRSVLIVNQPLAQGGWVATIEDITERRNLEQERDRNYAFLRQIIDHIPSQITVKDARDRRYVLANRVAEIQFGLPHEAIVGKTAFDLFPKTAASAITADDDKEPAVRRRPVPGRAPLGKPDTGQSLHHVKTHRHSGSGRRSPVSSSTSSTTSPSAGAPTRRSRILRITTR